MLVDAAGAIHVPEDYDLSGLLKLLNQRVQGGKLALRYPEFRRWVTRDDPLIFQLLYLPHHLRRPETGDSLSFSTMHVKLADLARSWRGSFGTEGRRDAVIGPRGSGKSTCVLLSHPLWALAHNHRAFVAAFADSGDQARKHLGTLRGELEENELLATDYPDLCKPLKRGGRTVASSTEAWQSAGGSAIVARGLDAKSLGLKMGAVRPDVLLLDDPEAQDGRYSVEQAASRLRVIRQSVLGMNPNAAVVWTGTTTMFGGLAHDLVRHATGESTADWVRETRFRTHYFPALVRHADGSERSLWEQRWPTEYLLAERRRNPRDFAQDMQNQPIGADGKYWTRGDFSYDAPRGIDARVLWVDPAVTGNRTSDMSGLAVVGWSSSERRMLVELAEGIHGSVDEVGERVHQLVRVNPSIRTVIVETNQGGDLWSKVLEPLPRGATLKMVKSTVGKAERFADAHRLYRAGRVAHIKPFQLLEDQACQFPHGRYDDVLDAACGAILFFLGEDV